MNIVLFTQTGSRFIQKQLSDNINIEENGNIEDVKMYKMERQKQIHEFTTFILEQIGVDINVLMTDRYGNYFFQEFI